MSVLEYRCLYLSFWLFVNISFLVSLRLPHPAVHACLYGIHASNLLDIGSMFWHVKTCVYSPTIALRMPNIDPRICPSIGALASPGWRPWNPLLPFASRVLASIDGKCIPAIATWRTLARASAHPECPPGAQNDRSTCFYALFNRAAHAHSFRRVWHAPFRAAKASNAARIPLGNAFPNNSFNSSNFSKIPSATDSPRLRHVERTHKH